MFVVRPLTLRFSFLFVFPPRQQRRVIEIRTISSTFVLRMMHFDFAYPKIWSSCGWFIRPPVIRTIELYLLYRIEIVLSQQLRTDFKVNVGGFGERVNFLGVLMKPIGLMYYEFGIQG